MNEADAELAAELAKVNLEASRSAKNVGKLQAVPNPYAGCVHADPSTFGNRAYATIAVTEMSLRDCDSRLRGYMVDRLLYQWDELLKQDGFKLSGRNILQLTLTAPVEKVKIDGE